MARHKKINLKKQMTNLIEKNFYEGRDKHSDKKNGGTGTHRLYSRADREALVDTACLFANWVKDSKLDIKNITDIKTEHVQTFLNEKSPGWSDATVKTHISRLKKLDRIFDNSISKYEKQVIGHVVSPRASNETKCRSIAMSREDYTKLTDYASERKSHLKTALMVAGATGLRVSEIAKLKGTDYEPKSGVLSIVDSKGRRSRDIVVPEAQRPVFEALRACVGEGRVCPVQHESLSQALNRAMRACDLGEYINHKTGFHAIRKMVAQEMYDELKESGQSSKDAWDTVSVFLGHGKDREDLFKAYIIKP